MHDISGGTFIIMGVPGETVDEATASIISKVQPSGFILFARNIKSAEQVRALTDQLRSLVKHEPIIAIDEEGGRVSRLKSILRVPTPSAEQLRNCNSLKLVERHGELTARMLRLLGINLNLAPVLDIELNPGAENSLRGRMYGTAPKEVVRNARAFIKGMKRHGILCSGKHFPGYSAAQVDPHKAIPKVDRTVKELESMEWIPFRRMLPELDTIMTAHVHCESVVGALEPASLSPNAVHKILREDWKYKRCIMTDDLDMGAITTAYGMEDAAVRALDAGNDLMLICHSIPTMEAVKHALEAVSEAKRKDSAARIRKLRKRLSKPKKFNICKLIKLELEVAKLNQAVKAKTACC